MGKSRQSQITPETDATRDGPDYGNILDEDYNALDDSVLSRQKDEMLEEFEETERRRKRCASCNTVTTYMLSESTKSPTGFKIGVFTVFIVVMFITMLKSVVDTAPILFVKIGEDQVAAIDVTLRPLDLSKALIAGNVNYYAINPFVAPFGAGGGSCASWPPQDDPTTVGDFNF